MSDRVPTAPGPGEIGVTQTTSGGVHGTYVAYLHDLETFKEWLVSLEWDEKERKRVTLAEIIQYAKRIEKP